jgi:DNA polymerase-3 subunit epsilon
MYAVIDVETTGGSPSVDRIIEIAVIVYDGENILEQYSSLVNPHRNIDKYVTQLTGITDKMVKNAPSFEDIQEKILEITKEKIFVAHNVKFDYGMMRSEYKRLGVDFVRKQVDTVTLARKVMPGFNSYSLGSLCDSLGIVIENRHRALGDVEATVKLLNMILGQSTSKKYLEIELNHGIDPAILPPNITLGEIEKLPEEPGYFYMKDASDKVLFIDASKNVRREVIKFFNKAESLPERRAEQEVITQIDYQATGNELMARLGAYHEVRRVMPDFNKKPKDYKFSYAIFITTDSDGFKHLKIEKIDFTDGEATLKFQSKGTAQKVLYKIIAEGHLQVQFSLLHKITEPEQRENFKKSYNEKVDKAVRKYLYKNSNFFIVGDGRRPDENSVVCIENSVYMGMGYIAPELTELTTENLRACIKPEEDDLEIQKIIRQELRKGKGLKIVNF